MRLIACTYNEYSAAGGLHDAIQGTDASIMVFEDEQACIDSVDHSVDNLDIWDLDTLVLVGHYECKCIYAESGRLDSFRFIKKS